MPGMVLSHPESATTASKRCPREVSSIESATTSRRDERGAHALGAHRDAVDDRDGVELDGRAAGLADALLDVLGEWRRCTLHGMISIQVLATPTSGLARSSSVETDRLEHRARGRPRRSIDQHTGIGAQFIVSHLGSSPPII